MMAEEIKDAKHKCFLLADQCVTDLHPYTHKGQFREQLTEQSCYWTCEEDGVPKENPSVHRENIQPHNMKTSRRKTSGWTFLL